MSVVVGAIWNMDISFGSSVLELLTRVAAVLGSISGPVIYLYLNAHSSFPTTYVINVQTYKIV